MLISEKIEQKFIPLLQHTIKVTCNNKQLKTGRLLLVCHKSAAICLTIEDQEKNTVKTYDLPYPFSIAYDEDNNSLKFDYNIELLISNNDPTVKTLIDIILSKTEKTHRFLNNKILISCID